MGAKSVLEAIIAESGIIVEKWEDKENPYIGLKCNRGGIELKLSNKSADKWHEPLKELLGMIKSKDVLEIVAFAQKNKLPLQSENVKGRKSSFYREMAETSGSGVRQLRYA